MNFWKTNKLVEDLKNNSLDENNFKNYYLVTSIIVLLGYYLAILMPPENMGAMFFEAMGSIVITIYGINMAFKTNGGVNGLNFLNKTISIALPLTIKMFVACFILGIILGMMEESGLSKFYVEWILSVSVVFIQIVFYWRLALHIKNTNA